MPISPTARGSGAALLVGAALAFVSCTPDAGTERETSWPLSEIGEVAAAEPDGAEPVDGDEAAEGGAVGPGPARADDVGVGGTSAAAGSKEAAAAGSAEAAAAGSAPSLHAAPSDTGTGPSRPPMDMEVSGPMIHPPAPPRREDFEGARFARPEHVRGLYVNAWAAGSSRRMEEVLEIVRNTEVNSLVIDVKDATGFVSHASAVEELRSVGATGEIRIRDLPALLDRLEAEAVYPIARIVVIKDPLLSRARPDLAIQDTAGGVWIDSKELLWLNPYSREVWEYHVKLAREVAEMGFPEIQWDYIRFPDAPESDYARATFPGADGRPRYQAIRGFLAYAREELADLPVRSTADVFGVTTTFRRDIGLGQLWETFIDVVDVALPMVYPSHYWEGSFGYGTPNAYPYEVVKRALVDALRRSEGVDGAGLTRPWIQDFNLGEPLYGAPEVRAQIQAAYDVGIQEWIIWNPSTRYTVGALEPTGGFETEPLIRVAGVVAPVSRRAAVIDSVAALPPEPDSVATDSLRLIKTDSISGVAIDSLPTAPDLPPDTIARDTVPPVPPPSA